MVIKKHLKFILPLILLGLFAMKTFWGPNYFDGHDAQNHIIRLYQYDLALKDGQYPPRWAGSLLAGYGYPVFIFTYPLPYVVSEAFHLLGFNLAVSIKLTFVLAYLTSCLGMYWFATEYWQSKKAGFLSALLWSWAPPIFEKIFIGAALGSITSLVFVPFTLLFIYQLFKKPNLKQSVFLALSFTFWIHSHIITLIIFSPLLLFFFFSLLAQSKKTTLLIRYLSISLLLSFLLSLWYLLPAYLELKYTHFNSFVLDQYPDQFVSFKRLLYSKWGTDAPGWGNNPVSQQVGIAQWLAVGFSGILLFYGRLKTQVLKLLPFLLSFILSILLMLKLSRPIWDIAFFIKPVGIPWRYLSLSAFTAAASAGFICKASLKPLFRNYVAVLLILLALYGNRNHLRINQPVSYSDEFFQNYTSVATGWNEHLPIWIKNIPKQFPQNKVEVISGNCSVNYLQQKSNLVSFTVDCHQPATLQLNTAYYSGWQISDNQQDITDQVKDNLSSSNGMIQFSVNTGEHQIMAQFQDTPLRKITKYISLSSLGLIIFLLYFRK